jgi:amidase
MTDLYATARAMLADLKAKKISARELLGAHVARNDKISKTINAVIATDIPRAMKDADAIDGARAKGVPLGPLAGLPMTIKDGFDVENMPAVAGNPVFKDRPKNCADADLVAIARGAGALIWAKTNVPFMLSDFQSFNPVHGTTNNPYDVSRVPGGSSGGAAAALATGVTPLEIGSDIGGSLRHPANYCGVVSLKPTWGALSQRGHVPPPPGVSVETDLNVVGPMARNVGDLKLLWDVLRKRALSEPRPAKRGRIALWDEQMGWPLATAVKARLIAAGDAFTSVGFTVERASPRLDIDEMMNTYQDLLTNAIAVSFPQSLRDAMAKSREADLVAVREGRDSTGEARYRLRVTASDAEIAAAHRTRQAHKDSLDAFFAEGWDAILLPISPLPPFPHDHSLPLAARKLAIDGKTINYLDMLFWISLATSLHAPALALQAGQTAKGLPVGAQLVGPWNGEDRLFDFAAAVEEGLGGFRPPPGV